MALIVKKFGGSSVATAEKILQVARRVLKEKEPDDHVVVVVSAMGDTTDNLISLAGEIAAEPYHYKREMDMLLTTGEQMSAALLAMAFNTLGQKAVSLTGAMAGIKTDSSYTKGKIIDIQPAKVEAALQQGNIVVVAGFQGVDESGDYITLGRGGSDTSAVALAGALKADRCEIYTDVEGVYSADPRCVAEAQKMQEITYEEMLEMARLGAGVMQARSIEVGRKLDVPIHVRSTFSEAQGTMIQSAYTTALTSEIRGVAHDAQVAKISVLGITNQTGAAFKIFSALSAAKINIDMIVQNVRDGKNNLTDIIFTVADSDVEEAVALVDKIADEMEAIAVAVARKVAKVSVVGAGIAKNPGIAARIFGVLAKNQIEVDVISTSETSISCLVKRWEAEKAVQAIHREFFA